MQARDIGAQIVAVNYGDYNQIAEILEMYKVSVVISAINYLTNAAPELNLIRAAELCQTVHRYIPSIWGSFRYGKEY